MLLEAAYGGHTSCASYPPHTSVPSFRTCHKENRELLKKTLNSGRFQHEDGGCIHSAALPGK